MQLAPTEERGSMQAYVGCSGCKSYNVWSGHFYPVKLQSKSYLKYYIVKSLIMLKSTLHSFTGRLTAFIPCDSSSSTLASLHHPKVTASHHPKLPGHRPNLTSDQNHPKIEQCLMGCCVNLAGHTCDIFLAVKQPVKS
jgi:hypothetical protein